MTAGILSCVPPEGLLSSFGVDISKGIQNQLDDFVRYQFDTRYYCTPREGITFAGLARIGQVLSYSDSELVPDDQLFLLRRDPEVSGASRKTCCDLIKPRKSRRREDSCGRQPGGAHRHGHELGIDHLLRHRQRPEMPRWKEARTGSAHPWDSACATSPPSAPWACSTGTNWTGRKANRPVGFICPLDIVSNLSFICQ